MLTSNQFFAVLLITILSFSYISISFGQSSISADEFHVSFPNTQQENLNQLSQSQQYHVMKLFENISIVSNDEADTDQLSSKQQARYQRIISLHENISVKADDPDQKSVLIVKANSDRKAMMERIFYNEKKKAETTIPSSGISIYDLTDESKNY